MSPTMQQDEPHRRKRSRDSAAGDEHNGLQPRAKRRRISHHNYPPEVWDRLSKVTLTRKALREFDRRTAEKRSASTTRTEQRTTRPLRPKSQRLARFAELGGPDLSDLRGYAELSNAAAAMSHSSSRSGKRSRPSGVGSSTRTSTTGPYDPQFEQILIDAGVYPDGHRSTNGGRPPKPGNIDELHQRLLQPRPSLSPTAFSETAFEDFQDMNRRTKSEAKIMSRVIPTITGMRENECESEENIQFTNLEKFDPGLRAPQPDIYYGARPNQIDARVRAHLDKYLVPSKRTDLPVAPNFFLEGKSASGRVDVAERQAMYDGAVGARAMLELQNYGNTTTSYDGNAYSIASSYQPGTGLQLYATHPRQSATGQTEYHTTLLRGYRMTDTSESFRNGAAAYRNARDFSLECRERFIARANDVVQTLPAAATPSSRTGDRMTNSTATGNGSFESETSTDELAPDYDESAKRRRGDPRAKSRTSQNNATLRN